VAGLRSFETNRVDFKRLQAALSRGARRRRRPWRGLRWVEHAVGAEVVHDSELKVVIWRRPGAYLTSLLPIEWLLGCRCRSV